MQSNELGFMIDLDGLTSSQSSAVFKALEKVGYRFNCSAFKSKLLNQGLSYGYPTVLFLLPKRKSQFHYLGWQGDYINSTATQRSYAHYYQNYCDYITINVFELVKLLDTKNFSVETLYVLFGSDKDRRIRFDKNSNNYSYVFGPAPSLDF